MMDNQKIHIYCLIEGMKTFFSCLVPRITSRRWFLQFCLVLIIGEDNIQQMITPRVYFFKDSYPVILT